MKRNRYDQKNSEPVPKDSHQKLIQMAKAGVVTAQLSLGKMYAEGIDVSRNYSKAIKYYTLAATQGHAEAQSALGMMHYEGTGFPQDYKIAADLFTLAAEQGHAHAQDPAFSRWCSALALGSGATPHNSWPRLTVPDLARLPRISLTSSYSTDSFYSFSVLHIL